MKPNETIYAGEVQLAGWSDTHTGGAKIVLWLPSAEDLEKFRALTVRKGNVAGHRMMVAIVEIGDDEKPAPPPEPAHKNKPGPYCMEAIDLCRNAAFQVWAFDQIDGGEELCELMPNGEEAMAKGHILDTCAITSRKELDTNPDAQSAFINLIRLPFMQWQREQAERREEGEPT